MAHGGHDIVEERIELGSGARVLTGISAAVFFGALALAALLGFHAGGVSRFYFAYLASFAFFLAIALGALFFVLLQHVTRAGWSVDVRRVAECMSMAIPVLGVLSVVLLISVIQGKGDLYRWALPDSAISKEVQAAADRGEPESTPDHKAAEKSTNKEATDLPEPGAERKLDPLTVMKRHWLNPGFFIARIIVYFAIWSAMAFWYWRLSVRQDSTGDPALTLKLQAAAGPLIVLYGFTVTFAAFDLIMSLDPHWYSTMLGAYYFAAGELGFFAAIIFSLLILQNRGFLRESVTVEHYHDLGKFLFGFVFLWGYLAFAQYMLLWYAQLPETVLWLSRRGATTNPQHVSSWSWVALSILFGNLLIPFGGVMSRHIKRRPKLLGAWAVWILFFTFVDMYWLVMPEYGYWQGAAKFAKFSPSFADLAAFISIGGACLATWLFVASRHSLRPTRDPRLEESLEFQNA